MTVTFHGAGDPIDQHNGDPNAHAALFAGRLAAPVFVAPPASLVPAAAGASWFTASNYIAHRFTLPLAGTFRYVNFHVGTSSGNVQAGVVKMGADHLAWTKRMDSGVVACPASGAARLDCGATTLDAGEYALFLWCDNTTATFAHGNTAGFNGGRLAYSGGYGGGFGGTGAFGGFSTRFLYGLTLESA